MAWRASNYKPGPKGPWTSPRWIPIFNFPGQIFKDKLSYNWTIDNSAWFAIFNEDSGNGESLHPGSDHQDQQEVQIILNGEPEGFLSEDRFKALKDALLR